MSRASKTVLVAFIFSHSLFAQFEFGAGLGVKGGVPFTKLLQATGTINGLPVTALSRSGEYLVGPAAELRIPLGFALEVDGIYRSEDYRINTPNSFANTTVSSWEIPYLAKFRFPIPLLKPFISGGGAYRTFTERPSNTTPTHNGLVIGGGLELRIRRLRLSAEGRYLRWNGSNNNIGAKLKQDQSELLFGIMF